MMKRLLVVTGLLVTFGLPPLAAQDSPVLDRVVRERELRVATSGNQPPYNAVSKEGQLIGLDVDLVRLLADAMNVNLTLMSMPFPDLLPALAEGKVDMVVSGLSITPERAQSVSFVGPYVLSGKSVLTDSATLTRMKEPRDLDKPELTLVALANSTSQGYIERVAPRAKLVTTSDYDAAVALILNEEADALIADMPICILTVLRNPDKDLGTPSQPLNVEPIGIALPGNDQKFHDLIETYVDAFEKTGLLDELRKHWLEGGSWLNQIR